MRGAVTSAGNINVGGDGKVYGTPQPSNPDMAQMNQWSSCASVPVDSVYGVSVGTNATFTDLKNGVSGYPSPYEKNAVSGNDSTYISYGSETWKSLVANADIKLPGTTATTTYSPAPSVTLTLPVQCKYSDPQNWGEPWRTLQAGGSNVPVTPVCQDYFPTVYIDGDLFINKGRGQGILIVNGNLSFAGRFEWYGLIIVRDEVMPGNGEVNIFGGLMARSASVGMGGDADNTSNLTGNQNIYFSRCALEAARSASPTLITVRQRSWAQFF